MRLRLRVVNPTETVTHLVVSVDYEKGGTNYLSGAANPRGIYAYVRPVVINDGFEQWAIFTGRKTLLESLKRANPARLQHWKDEASAQFANRAGKVWELIQRVCLDSSVELLEGREVMVSA